jgi:hypothetical protein
MQKIVRDELVPQILSDNDFIEPRQPRYRRFRNMARGLFVISMAFLAGGFSSVCFAQDPAAGDSSKLTRDAFKSRVNADRERLDQRREELRREHEKQVGRRREEIQLDREKRFGLKQEELRLGREKRIEPKRDELRRDREGQKDLRGLN